MSPHAATASGLNTFDRMIEDAVGVVAVGNNARRQAVAERLAERSLRILLVGQLLIDEIRFELGRVRESRR